MTNKKGFTSCQNKGFQMTFNNGMTISVQWGIANYCSRRSLDPSINSEMTMLHVESDDAEIAIWDDSGKWFEFEYDQVKPYCTPDEVAMIMNLVKGANNFEDLKELLIELKLY